MQNYPELSPGAETKLRPYACVLCVIFMVSSIADDAY